MDAQHIGLPLQLNSSETNIDERDKETLLYRQMSFRKKDKKTALFILQCSLTPALNPSLRSRGQPHRSSQGPTPNSEPVPGY